MFTATDAISNEDLKIENVPLPDAEWEDIQQFALTFNAYKYWGSKDKHADIANNRRHGTLAELRTCLDFEQRRWWRFDGDIDEVSMLYIRELIEKIRQKLAKQPAGGKE